MNSSQGILFSPFKLGLVTLRNRAIRAAAFEGMYTGKWPRLHLHEPAHQAVCIKNIKDPDPRTVKLLQ